MGKMFHKITINELTEKQIESLKESAFDRYYSECRKASTQPQASDPELIEVAPGYIRFFNSKAEELATVFVDIDRYTEKMVFHMNCVFPETP